MSKVNYLKVMSADVVQMYLQNKTLITLFARANTANTQTKQKIRQEMYLSLVKNYRRLNKMGIEQVHFYLPDNTSFLKMYNFKEHSDDLTDIRASVVKANTTLKSQEGFERR